MTSRLLWWLQTSTHGLSGMFSRERTSTWNRNAEKNVLHKAMTPLKNRMTVLIELRQNVRLQI